MADIFRALAGAAEGFAGGPEAVRSRQRHEMDMETRKMERWLTIAMNPQFSMPLRNRAMQEATKTKSFRTLANQVGGKWFSDDYDFSDMLGQMDNPYVSYDPRTGQVSRISGRLGGEQSKPEDRSKLVDRLVQLSSDIDNLKSDPQKKYEVTELKHEYDDVRNKLAALRGEDFRPRDITGNVIPQTYTAPEVEAYDRETRKPVSFSPRQTSGAFSAIPSPTVNWPEITTQADQWLEPPIPVTSETKKEEVDAIAGAKPLRIFNPKTGERRISFDGGQTWQKLQ